LSSNQELFMNINDIIGKAWLLSLDNLDNSEGYVLSFKLVERDNSSFTSPETQQEETTTSIENNSSNVASSENSENELNRPINGESIIESSDAANAISSENSENEQNQPSHQEPITESPEEYNGIKKELCSEFRNLRTHKICQDFVEQINNYLQDSNILPIIYEELGGTSTSEKMINLIEQFRERSPLKELRPIYYIFKKDINL